LIDLRLVEVGNRLEVGGPITLFNEEPLVVFQSVRRSRHRITQAICVIVLGHLTHALLVVCGGHQLQIRLRREPHRLGLPAGGLHGEPGDVEALAFEEGGEDQLAFPALGVLRHHAANGLLLALITSGARQQRGDVLDQALHADGVRHLLSERQRFIGAVALGHHQPEDALAPQGLHAEARHHRAVDPAGQPQHGAPPAHAIEDLVANRGGDSCGLRRSIEVESGRDNHG
jgi:hypothetical protein